MAKLLTWDPAKNKRVLVGNLIGDTLFRDVDPKHFMRIVNGYGIQEVAFQEIVLSGVKKIILKETKTEQQWEGDIYDWLYNSKIADYGHGKQRFLSLKFMRTHQVKPIEQVVHERQKKAEQLRIT